MLQVLTMHHASILRAIRRAHSNRARFNLIAVSLFAFFAIAASATPSDAQVVLLNGQSTPAPISVSPGSTVAVSVSGGPNVLWNWVALAPVGAADNVYTDWWWLDGTKVAPSIPLSAGTLSALMPSTAGTYEFRFFTYEWQRLATSALVTVAEGGSAIIRLNGATTAITTAADSTVSVNVTGGPAQLWNWVALRAVGTPGDGYQDWWWMNGTKVAPSEPILPATFNAPMPSAAGTYELRYYTYDWQVLATSAPITVTPAPPTIRLNGTTNPITAPPGILLSVTASGGPVHVWNWVSIRAIGAPGETYLDWWWMNGTKEIPSAPIVPATFNVPLPTAPGTYEFRYYTYNPQGGENWQRLATSAVVTVADVPPAIKINGTTNPATVLADETIQLEVSGGPPHVQNWVSLRKVGAPGETYQNWWWMNGTQVEPTTPILPAILNVSIPSPGDYEFRYYTRDGASWLRLATSATVTAPGPVIAVNGAVAPAAINVTGGSTVAVAVSGGTGHIYDTVALFGVGAANSQRIDWWYLNGSKTPPAGPIVTAAFNIPVPAVSGTFELRYFRNNNDHFSTSGSIAVAGGVCTYTLNGQPPAAGLSGGQGMASFTASAGNACSWNATTPTSWITLTGAASGHGNASVAYFVAPNTTLNPRTGTITVAGASAQIGQTATALQFAINGEFEGGYSAVDNVNGFGTVASWWDYGWNTGPRAYYEVAARNSDSRQYVQAEGAADGISQFVSLVPNQEYVLSADVYVHEGNGVRMAIGTTGAVDDALADEGAVRLRAFYTPTAAYAPYNAQFVFQTLGSGGRFSVDHVSLKLASEVAAEERVNNGGFDAGYVVINDQHSYGDLGVYWNRFGTSSSNVLFSQEGGGNGNSQRVQHANEGDGIGQIVSVIPGQAYLLRANVAVSSVGAQIAIGPPSAPFAEHVVWCGGGGRYNLLQTLYYAPPGSSTAVVSVSGLRDDSEFWVDEISLIPTNLVNVDSGGHAGICLPMREVYFQVHNSMTMDPVAGATVEISPNYGSGPPRGTYPDGTVSYHVGEDPISFIVSANGYVSQVGLIPAGRSMTWAISLSPVGASGGPGSGGGGSGGSEGVTGCDFQFGVTAESPTLARLHIAALSGCLWNASVDTPGVTLTPSSGSGPGEIEVGIPEALSDEQVMQIRIAIGGYTVTLRDRVTANAQGLFGLPIPLPTWCIDSNSWLCRIVVIVTPGIGFPDGDQAGGGPPVLFGAETVTVQRAGEVLIGIQSGTGNGAVISNWRFVGPDPQQIVTSTSHSRVWGGRIVTNGTVFVNARWRGNDYPLQKQIIVTARQSFVTDGSLVSWTSSVPTAVEQQSPFTKYDENNHIVGTITANPPEDGIGGDGRSMPVLLAHILDNDISRVDDNGPNRHLWYVTSLVHDASSFDFVLHPDVLNPLSDWSTHQYDTWTGTAACTYELPSTGGFISWSNYRDGVRRHEGGNQHSHWATFAKAINDPAKNIRSGVEAIVSWADSSAESHLEKVSSEITSRIQAIYDTFANLAWGDRDHNLLEACPAWCNSSCSALNGRVNWKPYSPQE